MSQIGQAPIGYTVIDSENLHFDRSPVPFYRVRMSQMGQAPIPYAGTHCEDYTLIGGSPICSLCNIPNACAGVFQFCENQAAANHGRAGVVNVLDGQDSFGQSMVVQSLR
jgi:hypothetical protein